MEPKFKEGDRVEAKGYCGILIIDGIDEDLTDMLGKIHYSTVTEAYLQGKHKVNNGESYTEDELRLV